VLYFIDDFVVFGNAEAAGKEKITSRNMLFANIKSLIIFNCP